MKNILLATMVVVMLGCSGGSADSKPTDVDHTMNRDTLNRSGDTNAGRDTTVIDTLNKK